MATLREHGLEVLRKAGAYLNIGSKDETYLRTKEIGSPSLGGYNTSWKPSEYLINDTTLTKVPTTNLTDRKTFEVTNNTGFTIYAYPQNLIDGNNRKTIRPDESWNVDLGPDLDVYLIADSGGPAQPVEVLELS